jgi:hypothetical protein
MTDDVINQMNFLFNQFSKPALAFLIPALVFSLLETIQDLQCNPGKKWIKNKECMTDIAYLILNSVIRPYLLLGVAIIVWSFLLIIYTEDHLKEYLL